MLVRYNAWANGRLFDALFKLPDHELTELRNAGAGSIIKTLNHSYVVDLIWQANLERRPHGFTARNTEELPALKDLQMRQSGMDAWYVSCADGLTEQLLDELVEFRFVDGNPGAMRRADMLLHIVNHKTYHRGYVAEMLYESALKPPTMDLPVFLRDAAS